MAKDRFLVGPYRTGWQTDVDPWLIPEDAFDELRNAFVHDGQTRKRVGGKVLNPAATDPELNTRLRVNIGTTNGAGLLAGNVPGATYDVGQAFSIGSEVFTVNVLGAPAVMLTTGAATTHTYDTGTGAYSFNGAAATTDVYFYPATPVMGFAVYEQAALNAERTVAFDTQFAYEWVNGEWSRLTTGNDTWTGGNSDFFWSVSARGTTVDLNNLYTTNNTVADRIQYWNGATWTLLDPIYGTGGNDHVVTAKIIVFFKGRLILFNTTEITGTNTNFVNRIRFSQLGDPVAATAWRTDIAGRGGYIDIPTKEAIVTVEFIKDRLIVYCERSTYELVYTSNEVTPFGIQQINTELGVESTFSVIPFDKSVLGMGNVGLHGCNGVNVERIDKKIKDNVFDISNENSGQLRVHGIRDYFTEAVYWAYPSVEQQSLGLSDTFPNRVLCFDYESGSYGYFDDSITALGYQQNLTDLTWGGNPDEWEEADYPWGGLNVNEGFRNVVAGNQEGYTFIMDLYTPRNSPALQISNIAIAGNVLTITAYNHNISTFQYIMIENAQGTGTISNVNGTIYFVTPVTADTFTVTDLTSTVAGTYAGGGTIALVTPPDIQTKDYNFYIKRGINFTIEHIDFMVDRTVSGEVSLGYNTNTSIVSLDVDSALSGSQLGTNILETRPYLMVPYEQTMNQLWHTMYIQANGSFIQIRLFLSDVQIRNPNIVHSEFVLNAMVFHVNPTSMRLQS